MTQKFVDKGEIYDQFSQLTQQTKDLLASVQLLSDRMTEVLAENARLTIENDHLHAVIEQKHRQQQHEGLSESRKMLKQLYQEGFHVCSSMYGKRLEDNESCTFCLAAIYGKQNER